MVFKVISPRLFFIKEDANMKLKLFISIFDLSLAAILHFDQLYLLSFRF